MPTTSRDRRTGQFRHEWGVVAQWQDEAGYHEVAFCEHCRKFQIYGGGEGYDRVVGTREAMRRIPETAWLGAQ